MYKIIGYNEHHGIYDCTHAGEVIQTENTKSIRGFEKYEIIHGEEAAMKYSLVAFQMKHLLGEMLTIVEAAIPESNQQRALKSLVKNTFHSKLDWIYTLCGTPAEQDAQNMIGFGEEYDEQPPCNVNPNPNANKVR